MPRILAIGDIHGCSSALDTLIGFVQLRPDDQLIFLGDYIDRGPDSKGVLDRLIKLHRAGQAICLRGNHEVMMIAADLSMSDYRFWLHFGGQETLESYRQNDEPVTRETIPDEHRYFVEKTCIDWYETESHIFVHANLNPRLPIEQQSMNWLHWEALNAGHAPHMSGKVMICGHTEQRSGFPLVLDQAVCIDTWAYGEGWLTCLDVESGMFWQATELGETRTGQV